VATVEGEAVTAAVAATDFLLMLSIQLPVVVEQAAVMVEAAAVETEASVALAAVMGEAGYPLSY
jgi:hypothetical protein